MAADADQGGKRTERYEGFADYYSVSQRIARSIDEAVQEYATIQRTHAENGRVNFDGAGGRILAAALRLLPELKDQRDTENDVYDEILVRWLDDEPENDDLVVEPEPPMDGAIEQLMNARLKQGCPEFLHQFVIDIRRAGWELGYLQAGRHEAEEDVEWGEVDVRDMFG